jgi:dihydrofolate reductase
MASFRLYIAASLDGYAAPSDGDADWLADYPAEAMGFPEFLAGIDTVVMGHRTYRQVRSFDEWPYTGKRACVLSSERPADLPPEVEWYDLEFAALAERFTGQRRGDSWIVGGPETIHRAFAANVIERMELFVIPKLLGEGLPLFSWTAGSRSLTLTRSLAFSNGVVMLDYAVPRAVNGLAAGATDWEPVVIGSATQ